MELVGLLITMDPMLSKDPGFSLFSQNHVKDLGEFWQALLHNQWKLPEIILNAREGVMGKRPGKKIKFFFR